MTRPCSAAASARTISARDAAWMPATWQLHRPGPARAGHPQPGRQRAGRHAGGRHTHDRDRRRLSSAGEPLPLTPAPADGAYVDARRAATRASACPRRCCRTSSSRSSRPRSGQGHGLGLSTVYGIVKQNGGTIWVYSQPGRAPPSRSTLPALAAEEELPRPAGEKFLTARPPETMLLVEDEASVREYLAARTPPRTAMPSWRPARGRRPCEKVESFGGSHRSSWSPTW